MTTPQTQPLAALLSQHPEECAAVLSALCVEGFDGLPADDIVDALRETGGPLLTSGQTMAILGALETAGIAKEVGRRDWKVESGRDRYAIARQGAAAWLRERCPRTDKHRFYDLSNARLHEIAAHAMRSAVSEQDRVNAYRVRAQTDSAVPSWADEYRRILEALVERGVALDVDAEVAAVWGGRETETSAGAPAKGEQR